VPGACPAGPRLPDAAMWPRPAQYQQTSVEIGKYEAMEREN
jgi:hypothetical protein